jgi:hypothetical protein
MEIRSRNVSKIIGWIWIIALGLFFAVLMPQLASTQGLNGIAEPVAEDTISGIVIISGTAADPNFLRYELAFRSATVSDWIVFAQGDQPVSDGTLAVWDTTVGRESTPVFPDGIYQLRLRVVRTDYNYNEFFTAGVIVSNDEPTPTPTAAEGDDLEDQTSDGPQVGTPQPTIGPLPSLTPFPTPLPRATPLETIFRSDDETGSPDDEGGQGVFGQISSIDTSSFGRAFWQGVTLVALIFAALAVYLVFRGAFRRIWRTIQSKLFR